MMDKMILTLGETTVEIEMDDNGRYCLNDLYKASSAKRSKAPQQFFEISA